MAWRDQLRTASFRGAAFFVDTEERSGGRKVVLHEYPQRDVPFAEDLGLGARTFSLDAYVIGPDYMTARDALVGALEGKGVGALVLPYSGERKVVCTSFKTRETVDDGGMCRFSMDFTETPSQALQPSAADVSSTIVGTRSSALLSALGVTFADLYSVAQQPQFAIDSLTQVMSDATAAVDDAFSPIITAAQGLATFKSQVLALANSVTALVRAPLTLVVDVQAILGIAPSFAVSKRSAVLGLISVYDFQTTAAVPVGTTPTRARELVNQNQVKALWRQSAIAQAALTVVDVEFESYDDAVDIRDRILSRIDIETEDADDGVFTELQALRASLVSAVPGKDKDLARLVPISANVTVPSVVLAYGTFGDLLSELDMCARNRIRHSGFVPGSVTLQVLGRA